MFAVCFPFFCSLLLRRFSPLAAGFVLALARILRALLARTPCRASLALWLVSALRPASLKWFPFALLLAVAK
jgi:hypothetical protein